MSNRLHIEPTKFTNARTGNETFGVRIWDDYGQSYDNSWSSIPDDDMDVFRLVLDISDEVVCGMLEFIRDNQKGAFVGDTYYEWDQLKTVWEAHMEAASCPSRS